MRILEYPNYFTIDHISGYSRNRTGYGYMTIDIASAIAERGVDVDLLTQSYFTAESKYKGIRILRRTWFDVLVNVKPRHIIDCLRTFVRYRPPISKLLNVIFYHLSMGYFEKILNREKYDLIHIHGIGYYELPIINVCRRRNIKFCVTLHGLNSFNENVEVSNNERLIERRFLEIANSTNILVTVVSTGVRRIILDFLHVSRTDNFTVITNCFNIASSKKSDSIKMRDKYNISESAKIMLCIGNIGKNKNQMQVVRAYDLLQQTEKEKVYILFFGHDHANSELRAEITNRNLTSHLIYCGNVPKNELVTYYEQSDFVIMASLSEGFGLSMIEGFAFGLPSVTFSDLSAVEDIYHESAVYVVKERSDAALAHGMAHVICKTWKREEIQAHSRKFSIGSMGRSYTDFFTLNV